jgi:hypothetical protein
MRVTVAWLTVATGSDLGAERALAAGGTGGGKTSQGPAVTV